jgi:hypothetical protein
MVSYTIDGVEFNIDYSDGMLDFEIIDYPEHKIYHSMFYSNDDIFMNDLSPMCTSGSLYRFLRDAFNPDIHDIDIKIEVVTNQYYEITVTLIMSTRNFVKTFHVQYSRDIEPNTADDELATSPSRLPPIKVVPSTPPSTPANGYDDVEQCVYDGNCEYCKYYLEKLPASPCKFINDDFQETSLVETEFETPQLGESVLQVEYNTGSRNVFKYCEQKEYDLSSVSTDPDMPPLEEISDASTDTTVRETELLAPSDFESDTCSVVIHPDDQESKVVELQSIIDNCEDKIDRLYTECITVNEHERVIGDLKDKIDGM